MSRVLMGLERGAIGRREGENDGWRKERKRTYEEEDDDEVEEIEFGCKGISEAGMKDGKRCRKSRRIGRGEGSFRIYIYRTSRRVSPRSKQFNALENAI